MEKLPEATEEPIAMPSLGHELSKQSTPQRSPSRLDDNRPALTRTLSAPPYTIFTHRAKIFIVASVSVSSLISPFGATTFYPALNDLAADLRVTPTLINLSLTTYMIAQGIAPSFIAGMSDSNGRRFSFIVCFVIFVAANIGLALQTSYAALLVLRMVQAFGCSAAIALCTAVVADIATSAERGKYMGYATAGLLIGPAFGPTIGGVLDQFLGWRSTFWFLALFGGLLLVVFSVAFPETCRAVVGNGSIPARGVNQSVLGYIQQRRHAREAEDEDGLEHASIQLAAKRRKLSFPNPLHTLKILAEKESCIILLYNGFFFTGMIGLATPVIPVLYKDIYGLSTLDIGLCYIAMGMGSLVSALTTGHLVDWNFRRHAQRLGMEIRKGKQQDLRAFPIEKVRCQVIVPGHVIGTLALLAFGWTLKYQTSLAGPEVALFFIGFGVSTAFNISNTLVLDLHRDQPATATAAVNLVRCLMSAAGSAVILPMCHAMNPGWAFTFIALVYVVLLPVVFLIMMKGQGWRERAQQRKDAVAAADVEALASEDSRSIGGQDKQETEKGA
ncbi:hypothetical protein LTR53_011118 [Teratosphaeriaceae sp. CCFEE 6253]|nr:hypothetical protein LTR53_011118 [Teratosphaeriaceae sp. CCFEE 6253]